MSRFVGSAIAASLLAAGCRVLALSRDDPEGQRFYYISTAYTAGMVGGLTREELHAGLPYSNACQLSKSMAEHALASLLARPDSNAGQQPGAGLDGRGARPAPVARSQTGSYPTSVQGWICRSAGSKGLIRFN